MCWVSGKPPEHILQPSLLVSAQLLSVLRLVLGDCLLSETPARDSFGVGALPERRMTGHCFIDSFFW